MAIVVLSGLLAADLAAAPQAELWPRWEAHDPASTREIDHEAWAAFLDEYLVPDHPSGVTRFAYGEVGDADARSLQRYLDRLQDVEVSMLNRDEQLAYWLNLYNAATIDLIIDNYPVESIRDIGSGLLSRGPFDEEILRVEGEDISLNDIEHRIIRPIWQDPRIHYAVNCASIGCPDLHEEPFTASNWDRVFDQAAAEYINHPRGLRFEGNTLVLSSIYDWFIADFGGDLAGVIDHVLPYVTDARTAQRLRGFDGRVRHEYDWSLNEP
jgi:hypothetical protein